MSWYIDVIGSKDGAKRSVIAVLNKQAACVSVEEAKDILAVKERILSSIDELDCSGSLNGVTVCAHGARVTDDGVVCGTNLSVKVARVPLAL